MGREIDIYALMGGFAGMRKATSTRDAILVVQAIQTLRKTKLPDAYVDGVQDELLEMVGQTVPKDMLVHVYLTFHGAEDLATYMKVGVARDVSNRLSTLATGNPLPRLWAFKAPFIDRNYAMRVEAALLRHMNADRVTGEWVRVGGLSRSAADSVVESLAEVAGIACGRDVVFSQFEE